MELTEQDQSSKMISRVWGDFLSENRVKPFCEFSVIRNFLNFQSVTFPYSKSIEPIQ